MKPTVSLCMIVRDEESNLQACLESVQGLFDQIVVVDTGSKDGTPAVAARFGAEVHHFAWCDDFAAARNESRRHARGQWVFWMDADDRIDAANRALLLELFAGLSHEDAEANVAFSMTCRSGTHSDAIETSHLRLFANASELTWHRRVHETLAAADASRPIIIRNTDVVVHHLGYEDPVVWRRKQQRDLRLLQMDHAIDPNDATTLFYLGRAFLARGSSVEALRFLRRALRRDVHGTMPWAPKAYVMIGICLTRLNRRNESLAALETASSRYPEDPELLFERGRMLAQTNQFAEAEACFSRLLGMPRRNYAQWGARTGLQGSRSHLWLGMICERTGRIADAESHYRMSLALDPADGEAWGHLGQLYLMQRRWREMELVVQRLAGMQGGTVMAQVLLAEALMTQGRFDESRQLLESVIAAHPTMPWARWVLCDVLFMQGKNPQACIDAHRRALELDSSRRALVESRIETLRQQADRHRVATARQGNFAREALIAG